MDKSVSPLKKYLDSRNESIRSFSKRSHIRLSTLCRIYNGGIPQRGTAIRICRFTNKELSLQDFGY